jgi:hypothetical protein
MRVLFAGRCAQYYFGAISKRVSPRGMVEASRLQFVEGEHYDGTLLHPLADCPGSCSTHGICKVSSTRLRRTGDSRSKLQVVSKCLLPLAKEPDCRRRSTT